MSKEGDVDGPTRREEFPREEAGFKRLADAEEGLVHKASTGSDRRERNDR